MKLSDAVWKRHGLIWSPSASGSFSTGHATVPTPFVFDDGTVRIFVSCRDREGHARPFSFDVDLSTNPRVIEGSNEPLLELGNRGTFDQNGVLCTSVVATSSGKIYMYYAGFEQLKSIRYRIMAGLASSSDRGRSFERVSEAPILDRVPGELFFRGGPFVRATKDGFEMVYAGGTTWKKVGDKELPVYDLRLAESVDGVLWNSPSRVIIPTSERNFGFGRPWIFDSSHRETTLLVSIRDSCTDSYRMGFAEFSADWKLESLNYGIGLEPVGNEVESHQTVFPATVKAGGKIWCFYNGNDLGRDGVLLAELILK